jgi:hypothetical protein
MKSINSKECEPIDASKYDLKVRAYCTGDDKMEVKYYNSVNNDPQCLRPYSTSAGTV